MTMISVLQFLSKSHWLRKLAVLVVVFLPAFWMFGLLRENLVDIATWDMWEDAPLLQQWHDGSLGWSELYSAQIQHRIVFPRLLIIALHHLTGGDFRAQSWAAFGMCLLAAVFVYRLLRQTVGKSDWVPALALFANLLIFSPMLYQNVCWGSALWMCIPVPCLLGALLLLNGENFGWGKFAGAVAVVEVASHSFSHGLAIWPLLFCVILVSPSIGPVKRRALFAGIWLLIGGVTIGCYLHNFINVAWHAYDLKIGDHALSGGVGQSLHDTTGGGKFAKALDAFWGFIGSMWSRDPFDATDVLERAQGIGKFIVGVFGVSLAAVVGTPFGRRLWRECLPWMALAGYVIGVGLLVGLGRTTTGEFRALTPRYCVISLFLPIATLAILFLLLRAMVRCDCLGALVKTRVRFAAALGLGALMMLQYPSRQYGEHLMHVWKIGRLQAKGMAMFINTVEPEADNWEPLDRRDSHGHKLDAKANINIMRKLGLFKTPVFEAPKLSHFQNDGKLFEKGKGADLKARVEGNQLIVEGFAKYGFEKPADLVLLADAKTGMVLHLLQPQLNQLLKLYGLDYEYTHHAERLEGDVFNPFKRSIPLETLPAGESKLEAWGLDVAGMRIRKLPFVLRLSNAPGAATVQVQ